MSDYEKRRKLAEQYEREATALRIAWTAKRHEANNAWRAVDEVWERLTGRNSA